MTVTFFTIFPNFFASPLKESMLKRAVEMDAVTFEVVDIRSYAEDKHKVTDDRPFGGGAGMVLKVEPIFKALEIWKSNHKDGKKLVIATSASGTHFTQSVAQDLTGYDHLAILCGHYEGIDQRVLDHLVDVEIRIGDFVLTGGEPAALVIADAVTRLLPKVLGNQTSLDGESHHQPGAGNYPQYTRPAEFQGWQVPEVLQSGDHAAIQTWREQQRKKIND